MAGVSVVLFLHHPGCFISLLIHKHNEIILAENLPRTTARPASRSEAGECHGRKPVVRGLSDYIVNFFRYFNAIFN